MAIKDYSTDPDMNTTISGINIAEGCAPSGINNAIRQLMADVKEESEAVASQAASQAAKDSEQDEALSGLSTDVDERFEALEKSLDDVINENVAAIETFRQMRIGSIFYPMSTTLEAGTMWADGSLALFADYPEFAAKYNAGGFSGMVLAASATADEQAAYPGKFVLASDGSGLYLPRLTGLFIQASGTGDAGSYVAPGLPNITGTLLGYDYNGDSSPYWTGAFEWVAHGGGETSGGSHSGERQTNFYASRSNSIYGASDTVQPPSVKLCPAIYLGKTA